MSNARLAKFLRSLADLIDHDPNCPNSDGWLAGADIKPQPGTWRATFNHGQTYERVRLDRVIGPGHFKVIRLTNGHSMVLRPADFHPDDRQGLSDAAAQDMAETAVYESVDELSRPRGGSEMRVTPSGDQPE